MPRMTWIKAIVFSKPDASLCFDFYDMIETDSFDTLAAAGAYFATGFTAINAGTGEEMLEGQSKYAEGREPA